ncbi:ABC transporter ATP-binding protein [Nitrospina sp. 32_T5]|uniref:ABC transporter ATP-binding protein n=1 Tax=unclassified Nitrospina TaxID=2638683 RepID=UPI003F9BF5E3
MPTAHPIITLENVSRFYQAGSVRVTALSGIDMQLIQGDFVTIMGPSGGGKTTLLNLMGGLDRPDEGDIHINGNHVSEMNDRQLTELRRKEIGFVFQFFNLLPTLTVWENVELPLLLSGAPGRTRQSIETLLDYVGLLARKDSFPAEMSGGEMQRVAIARALVHQPSIVLADEPTGNLDSENGHKILDILKKASDDFATTVVVVTHNPTAAEYGNRHFRIQDGRLQTVNGNTGG